MKTERSTKRVPVLNEAIDVNLFARQLGAEDLDLHPVVIDEVQEIEDPKSRLSLSALSKAWADTSAFPLLVLVGVGRDARDLLGKEIDHYGARHIHAHHVGPLTSAQSHDIIARREQRGVGVSVAAASLVVSVAEGRPWKIQRLMYDSVYVWLARHPSDPTLTETTRLFVFGKSLTPVVDIAQLNIMVEVTDVRTALAELNRQGWPPPPVALSPLVYEAQPAPAALEESSLRAARTTAVGSPKAFPHSERRSVWRRMIDRVLRR
jgi:hypothetical protein